MRNYDYCTPTTEEIAKLDNEVSDLQDNLDELSHYAAELLCSIREKEDKTNNELSDWDEYADLKNMLLKLGYVIN